MTDYQISPNNNNTIFWIEVAKIKPNAEQPRREFDETQLNDLAESIKQYGILQPLLVTRKEIENENGTSVEYELIAGERRLRAARVAGLIQVPVIIRKETAEKIKLELALIENIQREDLNPVEKALAFKRLSDDFNMKHHEIAEKVGKSRVYVTNTIRLLNLPEEMTRAIREGKITEGHARPLLMLSEKPDDQKALFDEIVYRKINVRQSEKISRRIAYERMRKQEGLPFNEEMRNLELSLANTLGTRVFIDRKGDSGKIMIDFTDTNHLNTLLSLIKSAKEKDIFKQEDLNPFKNGFAESGEISIRDNDLSDLDSFSLTSPSEGNAILSAFTNQQEEIMPIFENSAEPETKNESEESLILEQ